MSVIRTVIISALAVLLVTCGPPPKGSGPGGRGAGIDPDACGKIDGSDVGRKVYQFLTASAELDRATLQLEASVYEACRRMAVELQVPTDGDIRTLCKRASQALEANLQVSVSQESRLVTRYDPPVCTTEVDFAAEVVATCEASVAADVAVTCQGTCGGTCSGRCDGTCRGSTGSGGQGGECNGVCEGTCRGRCSGDCQGYADVQASAECKASAELRANLRTECTEPKVRVVREDVTIVDDTKFQMAMRAIDAGMPTFLTVGKKAELALKATGLWVTTLGRLVRSSGELIGQLGERGVCVTGQLAAAFAAAAQVEARVSISIEVSAEFSASAGASPQ